MTPTKELIEEYREWLLDKIEEEDRDITIASAAMLEIAYEVLYAEVEEDNEQVVNTNLRFSFFSSCKNR